MDSSAPKYGAKGHALDQFVRNALTDQQRQEMYVVRVAGPNAGHTVLTADGEHVALRSIPVAAVSDPTCNLVISAGSEVDLDVLEMEIDKLDKLGYPVTDRLWVHEQATILTPEMRDREGGNDSPIQNRIGSTGKGIGEARAERIRRTAPIANDCAEELMAMGAQLLSRKLWDYIASGEDTEHRTIVIEGTQGYGLGLHAGCYPFCTSSDCRSVDFAAMAGVPLADYAVTTHVVYRTFPIRVAGNSGPMHEELDWAELSERSGGYIKPEKTTVTKKIRRIGSWDSPLATEAFGANRLSVDTRPWLMFADYVDPSLAGSTNVHQVAKSELLQDFIDSKVRPCWGRMPYFIGTGPGTGVFTSVR